MYYLWNYISERWGIPPSIEMLLVADLADEDLLKIDVVFEIFQQTEADVIKEQNNIEDNEKDPEWAYIKERQLSVKQTVNSHTFVVSLFHIIEKVLKARLAELNEDLRFERKEFDKVIYEISTYPKGFDVKRFRSYKKIKLLQEVANCAKHSLEVDKALETKHHTFKFRHELPYLGPFLHESEIVPSCWDFIREVYEHVEY